MTNTDALHAGIIYIYTFHILFVVYPIFIIFCISLYTFFIQSLISIMPLIVHSSTCRKTDHRVPRLLVLKISPLNGYDGKLSQSL